MAKKIGKVSGLLRILEEEDVEKKIETEEEKKDESEEDTDKVEESDEDEEKKDESDDEEKKDESDDEEKKDESDDEEKKDEVSAQTVDDDQEFVGEGEADDEDDLILLTADDDVEESDEEKKEESEDEEKKDESDDEEKKEESEEEEKAESEEEEKLEALLTKFGMPASTFVECKAILKQLVTEKAEALAKKAEAKIRKTYAESNTRKLKKLQENVKVYAQRSAARFVEENKQKFIETAQFEAHAAFVKKAQKLFSEFGIELEPGMKNVVEGLRHQVKERNLEIDRLNSKNEGLALKIEAHKIAGAIKTMTEGMTLSDAERFVKIVEGLEIKDYADFMKRAASVKEKVFTASNGEYKSFVENFEQKNQKNENLGIKTESSVNENLVSAAASVLSGHHG
ncbi:head scaffolding protein [Sinorhizobium phage phiM9]|uniref:Prohead core protein n=1 Tax=Sinorhizobium phage phiM9 TaxID=1636182 RepID=A0A0F6R4Z8_9CAUD|nr:head scaffolding protein [Sinorhizobium phage phiM9]AKE44727.1 prohead core protein [Sinorhizobium phage phiM9]